MEIYYWLFLVFRMIIIAGCNNRLIAKMLSFPLCYLKTVLDNLEVLECYLLIMSSGALSLKFMKSLNISKRILSWVSRYYSANNTISRKGVKMLADPTFCEISE